MVAIDRLEDDVSQGLPDAEKRATEHPGLSAYDPAADTDYDPNTGDRRVNPATSRSLLQQEQNAHNNTAPSAPETQSPEPGRVKKAVNFFWGSPKRKAASLLGIFGTSAGVGATVFLGFYSGPFQFIHLSQILSTSHFGHMQMNSKTRMGRILIDMFRQASSPGERLANTRLNTLEYLYKNRTLSNLADKGLTPKLTKEGLFEGFEVDPTNPNSPFYNDYAARRSTLPTRADAIRATTDAVQKSFGDSLTVTSDGESIFVQGENGIISDSGIKALAGALSSGDHPFMDSFWYFVRIRTLGKWTLAGFHPLLKLDAKTTAAKNALVAKWWQGLKDLVSKGAEPSSADGAALQEKDAHGNVTTEALTGGEGAIDEVAAESVLLNPKAAFALKGAGIAGTGVVVVCTLKAVNDNIGIIRYFQVIAPMIRIAMTYIPVGNQFQSGRDVDLDEAGVLSQNLVSRDKTGAITSDWSEAAPIQAETGGSGGIDMDQSVKDTFQGSPPFLAWTESAPVKSLCHPAVQLAFGAIGLATAIIVPEVSVLSALAQTVAFAGLSVAATNFMSHLLAGAAVNLNATGAQLGNDMDYGARLAANANAIPYGGVALTGAESARLAAAEQAQNTQQFQSQSLAYRLFNLYDYRSLASQTVDQIGISSPQDVVAKIGNIPDIIGSLFRVPSQILSATVHAAPTPYNYPFPEYGFSLQDMDSSLIQDPAENAAVVGTILDKAVANNDQTYIDKALDCFGVDITKGADGWDAIPTTASSTDGQDRTFGVNPYDDAHYNTSNCISSGDTNWLRIRFWIFDTATIEGYTCFYGDDVSCANSGF